MLKAYLYMSYYAEHCFLLYIIGRNDGNVEKYFPHG